MALSQRMPPVFPPPWASAWGVDRRSLYPFAALELAPGAAMRFRWVPPGRFLMGSPDAPDEELGRWGDEGPQHGVTLSRGFWLGEAPCTQAEWQAVMGEDPSQFKGDARPVEQVSWGECQEFCARLRERLPELEARLPTEAEWEYACRAGTTTAFNDGSPCTEPEGNDLALRKLGWFAANSGRETHPVAMLEPNGWGLYDMHGNVLEWCQDWYGPYDAQEQTDPTGPDGGTDRVFRGGSWVIVARHCRSASRGGRPPAVRYSLLGLRLAAGQPR